MEDIDSTTGVGPIYIFIYSGSEMLAPSNQAIRMNIAGIIARIPREQQEFLTKFTFFSRSRTLIRGILRSQALGVKSPARRIQIYYFRKCSSWDPPAQETTTLPETVVDEAYDSNIYTGVELEDTTSETVVGNGRLLDHADRHTHAGDVGTQ